MNTNTQPSEAIDTQRKLEAEIADFLRQRIEDGNLECGGHPCAPGTLWSDGPRGVPRRNA
ncbi:hypothetical protein ACNUI5_12735 [Pseudomonas aeruginosa]